MIINMYVIKNVMKNLGRNKGRNILMGIIILAIIVTTSIAIIINTTANAIIKDYKTRFGSEVFLEPDYSQFITSSNSDSPKSNIESFESLMPDQLFAFGKSDYLQSSEYTGTLYAIPKDLKALDEDAENESNGLFSMEARSSSSDEMKDYISPKGMVIGSSRSDISDDFKNGKRKIIDGVAYKNLNECIISKQYAELNGLSIGDTITIENNDKEKTYPHDLTIVGIYEDNTMVGEKQMFKSPLTNRGNEILTSIETIIGFENFNERGYVDAKYFLKNPEMLAAFTEEVKGKGLTEFYNVKTDEEGYNNIVGPVEAMTKVTTTFMIVVLILGGIILILLSTLAIRERKYEIGVLRAMGMKKGKVGFGLISEMIVLTVICLALGLGVSAFASQPVADTLLDKQIEIIENNNKNQMNGKMTFNIDSRSSEENTPLSELEVNLNSQAIAQISLIALGLAVVSSVVGIFYITKYEPIKILSERN